MGDLEVQDFRMIERHYFKGRLIKSFDFRFGFCIPGSTNNWDSVYAVPPLSNDESKLFHISAIFDVFIHTISFISILYLLSFSHSLYFSIYIGA